VNDLTAVVKQLPNFADVNAFAILRHRTSQKVRQYQFRPKRVKDALLWLVSHNHLYEHVMTSFPTHINWMSDVEVDLESMDDIMLNDEELEQLQGNSGDNDSILPPSTNPGAREGENEVLLMLPEIVDDSQTGSLFEAAHSRPIVERGACEVFVDPFNKPLYYWERLFPSLFPYGRGGPSDSGSQHNHKISGFAKRMLQRGGTLFGRRFQ